MSNMSNKVTEPYKHRFSLEEKPGDNKFVLQIVGKAIEVLNKGNRYHSAYLPYSIYPSVSVLTKKVSDDVSGFGLARYLQRGRIEKLG